MVTLGTYVVSTGKSTVTYTRMRPPYVNPDGFQFNLFAETLDELCRMGSAYEKNPGVTLRHERT